MRIEVAAVLLQPPTATPHAVRSPANINAATFMVERGDEITLHRSDTFEVGGVHFAVLADSGEPIRK